MIKVTPDPPSRYTSPLADTLSPEEVLKNCAATAYESGDGLSGSPRAMVFSVLHLVEMAKAMVDRSLDSLPLR